MPEYRLTLRHDHCNVLASALALYVKIGCGRWEALLPHAPTTQMVNPMRMDDGFQDIPEAVTQEAYGVLVGMRDECFIGIEPGGFPLSHPRVMDRTRVAFDLLQAVTQILGGVGPFTRTSMGAPMVGQMVAEDDLAVLTFDSEHHGRVLMEALEILGRVGLGQWGSILDHYRLDGDAMVFGFREPLRRLGAAYVGMMDGGSYSASSAQTPPASKIAFEMWTTIRHRFAWDRSPEGGNTVDFYDPMNLTQVPFPTISQATP